MKAFLLAMSAAAAFALAAPAANATPEISAEAQAAYAQAKPKAKKKPRRARVVRQQGQIACTWSGCHPVPRGCRVEQGRYWSGMTTGFDVVVCPSRPGPY